MMLVLTLRDWLISTRWSFYLTSGSVCVMFMCFIVFFIFFFFQAEDGIRDLYVTGVQTCALPISFFCISGSEFVEMFVGDRSTNSEPLMQKNGTPASPGDGAREAAQRGAPPSRSEERRVGKEGRSGGWADRETEKRARDEVEER